VAAVVTRLDAQESRTKKSAVTDCASLTAVKLDDVQITAAAAVEPTTAQRAMGRGTACRVDGVIGKETRFRALLPDDWNRRLMMGGGGGFVGAVENQAETAANYGYATVGTDAGHTGIAITASWALNNDERKSSYAADAVHRTAGVTKRLIRAYYGSPPERSYFLGCSNGGRQALMEAQRFPEDFDGIVSLAPAIDFAAIGGAFIRNLQAQFPTGDFSKPAITPENLALIQRKILDTCDTRDAVRDSVLEDPRGCDFKLASIAACPNDAPAADCLTRAQRAAIEAVYAPVRTPGALRYPGQPFGNEADPGWQTWISAITPMALAATKNGAPTIQGAFGTEFFKYLVFGDSTWDYRRYDLSRSAADTKAINALLSPNNPDLTAFAKRGGKLILAHGWSDPALNPQMTIDYFEAVRRRDASASQYTRLFMMPGVLHCVGGTGCDTADWYSVITAWVERGVAPERVVARKLGAGGSAIRSRPLCAYPRHAVYSGSGSTDDEKSFTCKPAA
jgi:feruloyl esterase